jgi:hypothetical protein
MPYETFALRFKCGHVLNVAIIHSSHHVTCYVYCRTSSRVLARKTYSECPKENVGRDGHRTGLRCVDGVLRVRRCRVIESLRLILDRGEPKRRAARVERELDVRERTSSWKRRNQCACYRAIRKRWRRHDRRARSQKRCGALKSNANLYVCRVRVPAALKPSNVSAKVCDASDAQQGRVNARRRARALFRA